MKIIKKALPNWKAESLFDSFIHFIVIMVIGGFASGIISFLAAFTVMLYKLFAGWFGVW